MLTLREEILKNSGIISEEGTDCSKNKKDVDFFRRKFDELYEKAVEANNVTYGEFAGSDKYKEWVNKEIKPLFKNEGIKKIFEKWEQDLLFDLD